MKVWYAFIVLAAFFSAFLTPVSAHTLKIDGSIGVTIHIEPDDEPVAGSESKIFVSITDKAGRFNPDNPSNCACILTMRRDGSDVKTMPVVTGGLYNQLRFTFPEAGTYQVLLSGSPTGPPQFQAFRTEFEYYVRSGSGGGIPRNSTANPLAATVPMAAAVAGTLVIVLLLFPTPSQKIQPQPTVS